MSSGLAGLLLASLLALPAAQAEGACQDLTTLGSTLQVAWISPVRRRVGARRTLQVVRTADLRAFIQRESADTTRVLQGIGVVGARGGGPFRPDRYKITLFDVEAAWLCRPLPERQEGELVAGVAACAERQSDAGHFATSCGYARDTAIDGRGLDLYHIRWRDACRWGFCVMPLERFISGA